MKLLIDQLDEIVRMNGIAMKRKERLYQKQIESQVAYVKKLYIQAKEKNNVVNVDVYDHVSTIVAPFFSDKAHSTLKSLADRDGLVMKYGIWAVENYTKIMMTIDLYGSHGYDMDERVRYYECPRIGLSKYMYNGE